jgi:hypothetical protein
LAKKLILYTVANISAEDSHGEFVVEEEQEVGL